MLIALRTLAALGVVLASGSARAIAPPEEVAPAARLERIVTVRLAPGASVEGVVQRARAAGLPVRAKGPAGPLAFLDLLVESGDVAATAAALRRMPDIDLAETNAAGSYDAVTPDD